MLKSNSGPILGCAVAEFKPGSGFGDWFETELESNSDPLLVCFNFASFCWLLDKAIRLFFG